MSQEVRILTYCDNIKKHRDEDVPAEPLPLLAVGNKKPRQLDLCTECRVELFEPLYALLDNEGRATDTGRRKHKKQQPSEAPSGAFACQHCERNFDTERGLQVHTARAHAVEPQDVVRGCAVADDHAVLVDLEMGQDDELFVENELGRGRLLPGCVPPLHVSIHVHTGEG